MSEPEQTPVAWAFYHPNGELRFIIDNEQRMLAWRSAHEGKIVPLVAQAETRQA